MQQLQPNTNLQGGKYRIERVLGQGGFGITYLAVQVTLNRYVAIKEFFIENLCDRSVSESTIMRTISNSSVSMVDRYKQKFLKEARIISELHHENIINVYDVFEENGTAYYVMEYIDGGSLGGLLQQRGTLPENEAVNYITRIVHAVDYLHQRRINHFDIKPDNIMLRRDGTPVLIDFGISKQYDQTGAATTTTPVGISNGYAPIEQYSPDGVNSFSPQTDIYSLGATLYKLVTGQTPPSAPARSGGARFYMPSALRASTRNAISGAMKINKDERIGSARQFFDTLAGAAEPGGQLQQPEGSSAWKYVVAGLIAVVLIIVGYNIYDNSQKGFPETDPAPVDTAVTDNYALDSVQEATQEVAEFSTKNYSKKRKKGNSECSLSIDFPVSENKILVRNIIEWINESLGGKYRGDFNDYQGFLDFYTNIEENMEENTKIQLVYKTDKYITYELENYFYIQGGAHGIEGVYGVTFRKDDGRKFGWDMIVNGTNLQNEIKSGLKDYFEVSSDEELAEALMLSDEYSINNLPKPNIAPWLNSKGLVFMYGNYEIACYAAGQPTFTIPYSRLNNILTSTALDMIE